MRLSHKSGFLLSALFFMAAALLLGSCRKNIISYVEMIDRETGEMTDFFNKEGITTTDAFPSGLATPEGTFVKVEEGLFVRVIKAGTKAPVNGQTVVNARFNLESISPRADFNYILYGPQSGGTDVLPFVYYDTPDRLELSPKASPSEAQNQQFLCQALLKTVKLAGGDGAEVQIVSSFRYGPAMLSRDGIPSYFSIVRFWFD